MKESTCRWKKKESFKKKIIEVKVKTCIKKVYG